MLTDADRERFVDWLSRQVVADARGDLISASDTKPADILWLGRLAPEDAAWRTALGERGQRLDPSACGIRFRPKQWAWLLTVSFVVWLYDHDTHQWTKTERIQVNEKMEVDPAPGEHTVGADQIRAALDAADATKHRARVDYRVERGSQDGDVREVSVVLVNETPDGQRRIDGNLYEVRMALNVGEVEPIALESLPDTFRYDRTVPAVGIYGGVSYRDGILRTTDAAQADRRRPAYWDEAIGGAPDLSFGALSADPDSSLRALVSAHHRWGRRHWSEGVLERRARDEGWDGETRRLAASEAARYFEESALLEEGLDALRKPLVRQAFVLTNEAFKHSSNGKYAGWRPFQLGFLLIVLPSLIDPDHARRRTVDTLWFATGGGKTETYLAAVVLLCLYDRLSGKTQGITAWSRFPLRMLSLQQTQRFADVLAGAEMQRRREGIQGDPFALGFFVGGPPNGTPNRVRDDPGSGQPDAMDAEMPDKHRVLLHCPFCFNPGLTMKFNRRNWRLEHRCAAVGCPWPDRGLPFYCVDEEIYRLLPSVVVGTLDKAASLSMQAAMRGLYGAPWARCSLPEHGFTYAPRKATPIGCSVPGCTGKRFRLDQAAERFSPGLRVQDELHLLRDSLGAIDSHYETLLDHLQEEAGGPVPKLLASSATLAGFEHQVETLYARPGSVFPLPGPAPGSSFWTMDSQGLARRFLGLAPRGQTLEFANDRCAESLQRAVRRLRRDPAGVTADARVSPGAATQLLDEYGTDVVYGTKLRDVEAAARSLETQPGVAPLNAVQLTGRTPLDEVRHTLARLDAPESDFADRIHVVCASSMMSHGVDVDRFNVLTMLGLPLATAEFIQTSARVGRRSPGLVLVLHRMGVERDSSIFRAFPTFVQQGDRFVAPVAVTRRSKRVLEHTFSGLFLARVLGLHERRSFAKTGKGTVMARDLRSYVQGEADFEAAEFLAICRALGLDPSGDDPLAEEVRQHMRLTMRSVNEPGISATFAGDLTARPPMRSLREVETQIEIKSRRAE